MPTKNSPPRKGGEGRSNDAYVPPLVGFDDAPVAEKLNFSSIAFPREEIAHAAAQLIKHRMQGDDSLAFRQVFTPRPVIRRGPALRQDQELGHTVR